MTINIKKIIAEELSRLVEGDVVYPKFGGGPKPREQSDLELALGKVRDAIEEIIDDEGPSMDTSANDALHELLDYVDELYDKAVGGSGADDEEPFGAPASDRERSELERFKSWMKDQD